MVWRETQRNRHLTLREDTLEREKAFYSIRSLGRLEAPTAQKSQSYFIFAAESPKNTHCTSRVLRRNVKHCIRKTCTHARSLFATALAPVAAACGSFLSAWTATHSYTSTTFMSPNPIPSLAPARDATASLGGGRKMSSLNLVQTQMRQSRAGEAGL